MDMKEDTVGDPVDDAFEKVNDAATNAGNLERDGAPLNDLVLAADEFRVSLVSLLTVVMDQVETMGMAFQDEPW